METNASLALLQGQGMGVLAGDSGTSGIAEHPDLILVGGLAAVDAVDDHVKATVGR